MTALLDAYENIGGDGDAALRRSGFAYLTAELREGRVEEVPRSLFARFAQESVLTFEQHGCIRDDRPRFPVSRLRMLCLTMLACPTLRLAIETAIEFHRIAMNDFPMLALRVEGGTATLLMNIPRLEHSVGDLLVTMYGLTTFHRLFGWLTGEEIRLSHVGLAYPGRLEQPAFNDLLQLKSNFDSAHDSISFPAACLDRPVIRSYADLQNLFTLFPFDLLPPDYGAGALADHAGAAIRSALLRRDDIPGLDQLSRMFGLSTATFRRRLTAEGTSLVKIRQACRQEIAVDLLERSRLSIKEIAERVQFNDTATFRRAFRAWTGRSPSDFRARQVARAERMASLGGQRRTWPGRGPRPSEEAT
ncbi:MAG: AraC family transcriptional regulator ligand-binding domain-containing protein [Proteobacteria bacterium]|nr:AraC family transcriptional regulator ligand-binding domain-containing protein [Pseudomonadota bacterium]